MMESFCLGSEFFEGLEREDAEIARQVALSGCPQCDGPLHRGDYDRKPNGALVAPAAEAHPRRFSLCCGREGCRKRALPPSLRFLGRRVYVGAVVLLVGILARAGVDLRALRRTTGVPTRTTRRWLEWWQTVFVLTGVFANLRARITPTA
jgi:hypothetical protein